MKFIFRNSMILYTEVYLKENAFKALKNILALMLLKMYQNQKCKCKINGRIQDNYNRIFFDVKTINDLISGLRVKLWPYQLSCKIRFCN